MKITTMNRRALAPLTFLAAAVLGVASFALLANTASAQTATPTPVRTIELAPIDALDIRILESAPPQFQAAITSGLPSGCASFDSISTVRNGTRIDVTVRNAISVPPGGACTTIYGMVQKVVDLGSNFDAGVTYTVVVNTGGSRSMTKTFVAGASATPTPIVTPTPPIPAVPVVPRPANVGNAGFAAIGSGSPAVDLAICTALAASALALAVVASRMRRTRI